MAISRQSRHAALLVVATLAMIYIGTADAFCKQGYKDCDYNHKNGCETNVHTDVKNCGDCSKKCECGPYAIAKCEGGKCKYSCKAGWADCNHNWKDGCEKNVGKDVFNCGACGKKCECGPYAIAKCEGGSCKYSCKAGWANCNNNWKDGCEKDVGKDVFNCGACGKKCECGPNAIAKCEYGSCKYSCKAGWANCNNNWKDGCEKDVSKDVFNCGACGKKCECGPNAIAKCEYGSCKYSCKAGWANCNNNWKDGCEKAVSSDLHNCGSCGKACPKPTYFGGEATCKNGVCGHQCKKGMTFDAKKKCCVNSY